MVGDFVGKGFPRSHYLVWWVGLRLVLGLGLGLRLVLGLWLGLLSY